MSPALRPERDSGPCSDEIFLRQLVMEAVSEELGAESWPGELRGPLLDMQYAARRKAIRERFPAGRSHIIQLEGEDAGWLVVAEMDDEFRIVEIMLRKAHRGKGIGTAVIRGVQQSAARSHKPVRLHVNRTNLPAMRLYERLGFREIGGDAMTLFLECRNEAGEPAGRS